MGVALVADVPDNAVLREAEAAVQRNSQLNHAEIRRQVASVDRYNLDELFPDFRAKLRNLFLGKPLYVLRGMYLLRN